MSTQKPSKEQITDFVIGLIEENGKLPLGVDVSNFNYIDTGYVDSIGIVKFIVEIDEEYGVEINSSDIEKNDFRTIGGITNMIIEKLSLKSVV